MKKVSREHLSRYRQDIAHSAERLKCMYLKAAREDLLFGGTPLEVYRRCGKAGCKCEKGGEFRHGPYRVIAVREGARVRQITLRKDEAGLFEMVQHHRMQVANRAEIVRFQADLLDKLDAMLEARTIWEKPPRKKRAKAGLTSR